MGDEHAKLKRNLEEVRQMARFETSSERRTALMKSLWATVNKLKKQTALKKLTGLRKNWPNELYTPQVLNIDGKATHDGQEWLDGALRFGSTRFGDIDNPREIQVQRLEHLHAASEARRLDGLEPSQLEFWDTLQARAKMKPEGAAGADGITTDVYLQLPFLTLVYVHRLFKRRARFERSTPSSPFWKILQFIGLPKCKHASDFDSMRWICKSPLLQKWYLRSLQYGIRAQFQASHVHSYGFRPGISTSNVTGLARELLHTARAWNLPLLVSVQDVKFAFDSMPHGLIQAALLARGVAPQYVGLHTRELAGLQGNITLPFVGTTEMFDFDKGGKQGGVETPGEWRAVVDYIMEPVVRDWRSSSMGFEFVEEEGKGYRLTHAIWADNIIRFATSYAMMQVMIDAMDRAFCSYRDSQGRRYLHWKRDSLEFIAAGSLEDADVEPLRVECGGGGVEYQRKNQILLLGDYLDARGSTSTSVQYSMGKAETLYFKYQDVLRNKTLPVAKRLAGWRDSAGGSVAYNADTWHITAGLLSDLRTWELQFLRRVLRLRRKPNEGFMEYNQRTAIIIRRWQQEYNITMLYDRVLKAVYKAAWKGNKGVLDYGENPLNFARDYRNAAWWETLQVTSSQSKRRRLNLSHGRSGQQCASWENPFVKAWGSHWRARRDKCTSLLEWMGGYTEFAKALGAKWQLLWLGTYGQDDQKASNWTYTVKLPTEIDDIPYRLSNPKASKWDAAASRLWIQTDNQQVEQIFLGQSFLQEATLRPACTRIARTLFSLCELGWKPRMDTLSFIEWDPREYNAIADHAANVALDMQQDWERADEIEMNRAKCANANLHLCVDGARRGNATSSAGVALFASYPDGAHVLLYRSGRFLGYLSSAFAAEILALECGLNFLMLRIISTLNLQ